MIISTSFLSSKNIPKDLEKLDLTTTDYIHVDVMDGKFVNNKTMPFREMRHISKYTSKRLDVHLMVKDPKKYIDDYSMLNTEYITIHSEIENVEVFLQQIKQYGIKCGIAINPNTSVNEVIPYLPIIDLILIMSVEPGASGQEFIKETEEKIKEVKALISEYSSQAKISVDGGLTDKTKIYCKDCDIIVSGSYIINSDNFEERINSLR